MGPTEGWVIVIPAPGELASTARALLELAGDPQWVRTIGNGTEFMVHPDVASAYARKSPEPKPSKRRGRAPRTTTEE